MTFRFLCTIHNVRYGCEAVDDADASEEVKNLARIPQCPVCSWLELRKLTDELSRVKKQRNSLLAAIELKKDFLLIPDK